MSALKGCLGLLLGVVALAVLFFAIYTWPTRYRFRMTVEVATPEGVRSGSSVYEVLASRYPGILPEEARRIWTVKGEALAVDLPGGRTLFALLRTGSIQGDLVGMSMTALDPAFDNDIVESAGRIAGRDGVHERAVVATSDLPMLVRFRDIADPASVEKVDPANLAASFGPGYALRRVTVEVTKDPVTHGIDKRLGWLGHHRGALKKIRLGEYPPLGTPLPLAAQLTEGDFYEGVLK